MEKLSFPALIDHLKDCAADYNQLYNEQEMKSGSIDSALLSSWIVQVVEPVVVSAAAVSPHCLPNVFRAFYSSLLPLLGSKLAIIHEDEYQKAWSICTLIPTLVAQDPQRILKALNSALISLRQNQPEKVDEWIRLMGKTAVYCKTVETFLDCGRVIAWLCGMAHLREKAVRIYGRLHAEIRAILLDANLTASLDDVLVLPWGQVSSFQFQGVGGGFSGYGHPFTKPPLIAAIDSVMVASDDRSCTAVFADAFGTVLFRNISMKPERVRSVASVGSLGRQAVADIHAQTGFDDITSCVVLNHTLVLTRRSSHYLFIYSYSDQ